MELEGAQTGETSRVILGMRDTSPGRPVDTVRLPSSSDWMPVRWGDGRDRSLSASICGRSPQNLLGLVQPAHSTAMTAWLVLTMAVSVSLKGRTT